MTRNVNLQTEDAARWAEALVLLDVQAPHLAQSPLLRLRVETRNGRPRLAARAERSSATWHERVGVWVRYSCGFPWRGRRRTYGEPFFGINRTVRVRAGEPIRDGELVTVASDGRVVPFRTATAPAIIYGVVRGEVRSDGTIDVTIDARPTLPP